MLVNCEKISTRRPRGSISSSISISASSLADSSTARAEGTRTSLGSQHTCRSFISALRMSMVEAAMPFLRTTWRTAAWAARRMLS